MNTKPTVYQSAAKSKAAGYDKYYAWDMYVKDTGLKPDVDAKEFYNIYASISPEVKQAVSIKATHFDAYFKRKCEITIDEYGVWYIVWEDGLTGGYPPCNPPEEGRYIPIGEA